MNFGSTVVQCASIYNIMYDVLFQIFFSLQMCIARLHFQNSCREFGLLPNFVEMEGALIHKTGDHLVSAFAMQRKKKKRAIGALQILCEITVDWNTNECHTLGPVLKSNFVFQVLNAKTRAYFLFPMVYLITILCCV